MKKTLSDNSGFTLIEVIMAIVVFGIVAVSVGSLLYQGSKSYEVMDTKRELAEQGGFAIDRISREMRLIRCAASGSTCMPSSSDITSMSATEVRFVNTNNEGKGFRLDAGTLKMRRGSGATDPEDMLAENVAAFTMEYFKADGTNAASASEVWRVKASLTLSSGGDSVDFTASVHPRHFRQ